MGSQRHASAVLLPGKKPVLIVQGARLARGRSGRVRKVSPPPTGFRSPDRPARSKSQYRLSCTGPPTKAVTHYTAKLETEFQISWMPELPPLITKIATGQDLKQVPSTAIFLISEFPARSSSFFHVVVFQEVSPTKS